MNAYGAYDLERESSAHGGGCRKPPGRNQDGVGRARPTGIARARGSWSSGRGRGKREASAPAQALGVQAVILVDTNAWVNHLRRKDARLVALLLEGRVRTTDVVVGELLLGTGLPKSFAADLGALAKLPSPSATETLAFIERRRRAFAGSGVGWADAQIIVAAAKAGARLYSSDRAVLKVCRASGVALA